MNLSKTITDIDVKSHNKQLSWDLLFQIPGSRLEIMIYVTNFYMDEKIETQNPRLLYSYPKITYSLWMHQTHCLRVWEKITDITGYIIQDSLSRNVI